MRTSNSFLMVLLASVALLSACSLVSASRPFGGGQEENAKDEVQLLKERIFELEKRAVMAEVEVKRLQARLADLEGDPAGPEASIPMGTSGSLPDAVTTLEPSPTFESFESIGTEEVEVSDLPVEGPVSTPPDQGVMSGPINAVGALDATAQALYDRGYTLYHQGRFLDSETAFQQFLRNYSQTVLGDNAQFWIAEARYARGDVAGALAAFEETAERFPRGNKVPDAVLKVGDCLRDLGDSEGARRSYQRVVGEFPDSAAADVAEKRLRDAP